MSFPKRYWVGALTGIGVGIIVFFVFSRGAKAPAPLTPSTVATSSPSMVSATTTPVNQSVTPNTSSTIKLFPINIADKIKIGDFKGSYIGDEILIKQAHADIKNLTSLLGKKKYDDYNLYNGIANDYTSLGKGKLAYKNYNRSIRIHPNKGLAYANIAHFMDQLGAYYTAVDAYAKAVTVEPSVLEYHIERLNYLTRQFPKNTVFITKAFSDASKQFGDTAPILSIEAQWLTARGHYSNAIKAWETVKMLSPGRNTTSIDAEIARLKKKQ